MNYRSMGKVFIRGLLVLVLGVSCLFSAIAVHGQALAKRLILKDGSYQPVIKWEVRGKRVRYLSAERMEWEEVPSSMVDWPATQKYEQDQAVGNLPRVRELDKEEEAERVAEEGATPEVAPGLRLPDQDGIFVLDTFQGQPQLVELLQNGGEINRNMKGNVLRAVINPVASTKQTIELKGPHAQVQAHIARPVIFLRVIPEVGAGSAADKSAPAQKSATSQEANNPQQPQQPTSVMKNLAQLYRLVRCQPKKDNRVVGNINIAIYGKVSQKQSFVPANVEPVSGGWMRLMPSEDLAPGEYAVVEMLGEKEMNLYVWDFGVNPAATANASARKPQASAKETSEQPATLEKR